jgi:hypothetical protein
MRQTTSTTSDDGTLSPQNATELACVCSREMALHSGALYTKGGKRTSAPWPNDDSDEMTRNRRRHRGRKLKNHGRATTKFSAQPSQPRCPPAKKD